MKRIFLLSVTTLLAASSITGCKTSTEQKASKAEAGVIVAADINEIAQLGYAVSANNGQSYEQQQLDEIACYNVAINDTGFNPLNAQDITYEVQTGGPLLDPHEDRVENEEVYNTAAEEDTYKQNQLNSFINVFSDCMEGKGYAVN